MTPQKFSLIKRLKSFGYAFSGLIYLIKHEHNFLLHTLAAFLIIGLGIVFNIAPLEWIGIILSIGLVASMEAINSSIEILSDFVSPEKKVAVKNIKDISAAAVLISAITAICIGLIVFLPKIVEHV